MTITFTKGGTVVTLVEEGQCVSSYGVSEAGVVQVDALIGGVHPARNDRGNYQATISWLSERAHDSHEAARLWLHSHQLAVRGMGDVVQTDGGTVVVMQNASVRHEGRLMGQRSYSKYEVDGWLLEPSGGGALPPPVLTGVQSGLAVVWEWTAVTGAILYNLYVRIGLGAWELYPTDWLGTDSGDYDVTDTVTGKVHAVFPGGVEGPQSNVVEVTIAAPMFAAGLMHEGDGLTHGGEELAV